jgi:hypothetical protein
MVERVGKSLGGRRIGVTEPRIVRGNKVVAGGETRQQRLVRRLGVLQASARKIDFSI